MKRPPQCFMKRPLYEAASAVLYEAASAVLYEATSAVHSSVKAVYNKAQQHAPLVIAWLNRRHLPSCNCCERLNNAWREGGRERFMARVMKTPRNSYLRAAATAVPADWRMARGESAFCRLSQLGSRCQVMSFRALLLLLPRSQTPGHRRTRVDQ